MLKPSESSIALGAGFGVSVALPKFAGWKSVALVNGAAYAAASSLGDGTIELVSVGDPDASEAVDTALRTATGALSWALASAVAVPVVRVLPVPRPVAAVAAGVLMAYGNQRALSAMDAMTERVRSNRSQALA